MIRPDSLSVRIERGISIPFQLAVNGQIAELSVDFGAGKGIASIREFHALYFMSIPRIASASFNSFQFCAYGTSAFNAL